MLGPSGCLRGVSTGQKKKKAPQIISALSSLKMYKFQKGDGKKV